jgi:FMN phosphatase YigB (HAD superfamily)
VIDLLANVKSSIETMAPTNVVLAFDAYGTLLSTQSIAEKLASHFGKEKAEMIAATWRKYQLEYTWRANSMGIMPATTSLKLC